MEVQSANSMEISSRVLKNEAIKKEKMAQVEIQIDVKIDIYEHGESAKKVTYDKPDAKAKLKTIQQLKEESDRAYSQLKEIVRDMLKRQGLKFQENDDLKIEDLKEIKVDETAQKEAQAMIGPEGEYSPEKVSDRIVDFAKAISGGDTSKLDILKKAIDQGFAAAEGDFGRKLPDITKETYKQVMDKLDTWAHEDQTPESPSEDEAGCKSTEE